MLSFATFILLAYLYRSNVVKHKKFIFRAIVLPIEPIMGRVSDFFHVEKWELFYVLVWHDFFVSFFVFDWQTLKKNTSPIAGLDWVGSMSHVQFQFILEKETYNNWHFQDM